MTPNKKWGEKYAQRKIERERMSKEREIYIQNESKKLLKLTGRKIYESLILKAHGRLSIESKET